ncbi:MAG: hypothetical protein IJV43_08735 [Oscillospiraceae bacterium]|nr:hypothetical protein [Oscillospiraceae bacterium]
MEMDVSNLRVAQTNTYGKPDAVSSKAGSNAETAKAVSTDADAATFEADGGRSYSGSATRTGYTVDADTIERLKSENEARMANLVQQMLGKQISKNNILDAINSGRFSAADIAQAQKDTAEDGYWGVEQTSDRLVKFAVALTGGDPDKLDSMIAAFEKGYAAAEKQWGGNLPDLAQRTREATLKKFQDLKDQYANNTGPAAATAQAALEAKVQKAAEEA